MRKGRTHRITKLTHYVLPISFLTVLSLTDKLDRVSRQNIEKEIMTVQEVRDIEEVFDRSDDAPEEDTILNFLDVATYETSGSKFESYLAWIEG